MLISPQSPAKDCLKIVRVFSRTIEQVCFPSSRLFDELGKVEKTDPKCKEAYHPYALHHLIRDRNPKIRSLDAQLAGMRNKKQIPSQALIRQYHNLVHDAEKSELESGVDILLCTCSEASSSRISTTLSSEYCIVDECGMTTEPECMVPISHAKNVILIGDHEQLQPVIQNQEAKEMGLCTSLFSRYAEFIGMRPYMLQIQYRMVGTRCCSFTIYMHI